MIFALIAAIPVLLLTALHFYETSTRAPFRARAARSTLENTLNGRR